MSTCSERFKVIEIICCYNPTKTSGELEIDEIIKLFTFQMPLGAHDPSSKETSTIIPNIPETD